ncbi:hypothetical protein SK128_028506, partial [Halocaridina rubra]
VFLEVVFSVPGFSSCAYEMWVGLGSQQVVCADGATLMVVVPSPDMRPSVVEFLDRDFVKISAQYKGMGHGVKC